MQVDAGELIGELFGECTVLEDGFDICKYVFLCRLECVF